MVTSIGLWVQVAYSVKLWCIIDRKVKDLPMHCMTICFEVAVVVRQLFSLCAVSH